MSRSRGGKADTLPPRLIDALALDTADYQGAGWSRPPAAYEALYMRAAQAAPGPVPRAGRRTRTAAEPNLPTVARYLLAGRPRPRVEDSVKIGELMRLAALSRFGWDVDEATGRQRPRAPWQISGRDSDGKRLREPHHGHAFWLPEDADGDGRIDHVSVFISGGIDPRVRDRLDHIARLWTAPRQRAGEAAPDAAATEEWRLALEGFGRPEDFADGGGIFGASTRWRSATPFLASGHLKTAGHAGEFRRLLRRRGLDDCFGFDVRAVRIEERADIAVGEEPRRAIHFHRFRSRGGEARFDATGALLDVSFPVPVCGPLALGYASHFGLGLFAVPGD